jgi:hypothetical protein
VPLRFLGAHLFDLLDKLLYEGGGSEQSRRRVACAALDAVARDGAPVVRLWGTLKRTGVPGEVRDAANMLALVLDENARRTHPLRFVVTLLNHQAGYGAPDPSRSLDDQSAESPWQARRIYLGSSFREPGLLADRIAAFAARPEIARDPAILGWELVNELDTFRAVAGGDLGSPEAKVLRDSFLVPALGLLAESFPQPVLVGDLRGHRGAYVEFARGLLAALPPRVREKLVWTAHVYAPRARSAKDPALAESTWKLDLDLSIAATHGLPFLLGEIGQHVPGEKARFCGGGVRHDVQGLFDFVFSPGAAPLREDMKMALFWGEGRCGLEIPGAGGPLRISIGAGGDSADLGPAETKAREALRAARRAARFLVE